MRGNRDELRITAPTLGDNLFSGQLRLHSLWISSFFIDLIDGHHNRHTGCTRVLDGLFGLGHHAIISGHDQNNDIGRLRAPRTHCGKGGVAGRIEEGDHHLVSLHVVSTYVLSDATRFPASDVGFANVIKQ